MIADEFYQKWKSDFGFRTVANSMLSAAITVLFALYNSFLGTRYGIVWNGCISIYYYVLTILRGFISVGAVKYDKKDVKSRRNIYLISSYILVALSMSLVVPITLMVLNVKRVSMTMIPAISMATYTTYKVVMASLNMKRARNSMDSLVKLLRNINFIDAVISILTLQNTLLVVKASADRLDMMVLAAISSAVGLCVIVSMTVWNIVQGRKQSIEKETSYTK